MPAGEGSITHYLVRLEAGDETAVRAVLDYYLDRLEAYARRLLRGFGASAAVEDEQDLAHEAILIVVIGIRCKKYKDLHDREALSRLLLTITRRLVIKLKRYQTTRRRTGRRRDVMRFAEPDGLRVRVTRPAAQGGIAVGERSEGAGPQREWGAEEAIAQVPDRAEPGGDRRHRRGDQGGPRRPRRRPGPGYPPAEARGLHPRRDRRTARLLEADGLPPLPARLRFHQEVGR